jgi:hypothetical protein
MSRLHKLSSSLTRNTAEILTRALQELTGTRLHHFACNQSQTTCVATPVLTGRELVRMRRCDATNGKPGGGEAPPLI